MTIAGPFHEAKALRVIWASIRLDLTNPLNLGQGFTNAFIRFAAERACKMFKKSLIISPWKGQKWPPLIAFVEIRSPQKTGVEVGGWEEREG